MAANRRCRIRIIDPYRSLTLLPEFILDEASKVLTASFNPPILIRAKAHIDTEIANVGWNLPRHPDHDCWLTEVRIGMQPGDLRELLWLFISLTRPIMNP